MRMLMIAAVLALSTTTAPRVLHAQEPYAWRDGLVFHTFSIAGIDPRTGEKIDYLRVAAGRACPRGRCSQPGLLPLRCRRRRGLGRLARVWRELPGCARRGALVMPRVLKTLRF